MKASLQCRGLGSGHLPSLPSGSKPSARKLAVRVKCQQSTDQSSNPVAAADVSSAVPLPLPPPPPPGLEGSQALYPPAGYSYQAPQRVQHDQQYYMAAPPGYYPAPPAYKAQETSTGAPWWIWVGVGIIAANVINKVQEFMKNPKTPQQMMTEMAMKQMMGAMGNQPGPAGPFGKAGGMPPFPGGMPPFPPGGFAQAAAAQAQASSPTMDIPFTPAQGASPSPETVKKGEKFASRLSNQPTGSPPATGSSPGKESASPSEMELVEPIVKEPAGRAPQASQQAPRSSASFFSDVSSNPSSNTGSTSSSTGNGAQQGSTGARNGAGAAPGGGDTGSVMSEMMENMLRNPEMQKMLYPYLPEPMRNPSSIEWMLNNPEVKKQMAAMFEQQNMMSPQMMEMMKGMDFNQDKVNAQFQELGLKPEDVITKVMANPELAAGFQSPKVQAAIMDISQSPMNIVKYQNDPEVMKVLEQVTTLFQPDMAPGKRF